MKMGSLDWRIRPFRLQGFGSAAWQWILTAHADHRCSSARGRCWRISGQQRSSVTALEGGLGRAERRTHSGSRRGVRRSASIGPQQASTLLGAGVAARLQGAYRRCPAVSGRCAEDRSVADARVAAPRQRAVSDRRYRRRHRRLSAGARAESEQSAADADSSTPGARKPSSTAASVRQLGDHFTVLFEGPAEAELADRAVTLLEARLLAHRNRALHVSHRASSRSSSTRASSFATSRNRRNGPVARSTAASGCRSRARSRTAPSSSGCCAHEFTHALIQSVASRGVPTGCTRDWLIASMAATSARRNSRCDQRRRRLPLTRLEGSFAGLSANERVARLRGERRRGPHAARRGGRPRTRQPALGDLGQGVPFAEAFERHMLISYVEFQKKLAGLAAQSGIIRRHSRISRTDRDGDALTWESIRSWRFRQRWAC